MTRDAARSAADHAPSGQALPSFGVVIPAYQEAEGIGPCVSAVDAVLQSLPNEARLIVVDDGSTDGTGDVLEKAAAGAPSLLLATHPANRGYGAALKTGVEQAAAAGLDYVLFMDSDMTNDPADIPRFVEQMARGIDVIKASRYIPGGGRRGVPRWRVALSVVGNTMARWLFRLPIHDYTNGFRAVRTELLRDVDLSENGFAIIMEELYQLAPSVSTYAEIPVVLTNRAEGLRPSVFSYTPKSLWSFLKYPVMAATGRPRRKGTTT